MKTEFCTYEQSLALKELGFNEPFYTFGNSYYYRNGFFSQANDDALDYFKRFGDEVVIAPLKQQAFKFFREKYKLHGSTEPPVSNRRDSWGCYIQHTVNMQCVFQNIGYITYEEAESACIDKLIELAKEQKA